MAIPQAAVVLRNAEVEIAKLATAAAGQRDYDGAERLLGIARQLGATAEKLVAAADRAVSDAASKFRGDHVPDLVPEETDDQDLPRFERDGDELVKVGRSKGNRLYEHKAGRHALDDLIAVMRSAANKKGEFRSDRVLPVTSSSGGEVPAYQSYLCLAWLRQIGAIERVARQRYRIVSDGDLLTSVDTAWRGLHQR